VRTSIDLISYADGSFVVIHDQDKENLVRKTEESLSKHIESLEEIGMKLNEEKTEIIVFGKDNPSVLINVKGAAVESKNQIKALSILVYNGLTWRPHVTALKKRVRKVMGGARIIRNKLTEKQATSIVAAQIFLILFYACCIWLAPSLNRKTFGIVESLHYRALHQIICDCRQKVSREVITKRTKCLPPDKWTKFALVPKYVQSQ